MAEANPYANLGTLPPEIFQQQQELNRSQRIADLLTQNNQQPQGQMIGNRFVAPSWAAQLAPVVSSLAGNYIASKGDEKAAKIAQNLREYKTMENQAISEAVKAKDWNKVLDLSAQSYTGAGKEYVPSAIAAINPKPTELKQNYQDWLDSGGKGTLLDYQRYAANLKAEHPSFAPFESNGLMYTMNSRTGQATPLLDATGKPLVGKGKSLTEAEGKATTYQGTMMNAAKNMKDLEDKGYNPASFKNQAQLASPAVGNIALPAQSQQYKQAMDNFANAYLRFQSGANMSEHEIQRNLREMMPVFGDKPDVIKQKADAREQAIRFMSYSAGQGANMLQQNANQTAPVVPKAPTMPAANPAVPAANPAASKVMYATNGQTRIMSTDGGQTWQPAGGK
jgi:hypothetical protein